MEVTCIVKRKDSFSWLLELLGKCICRSRGEKAPPEVLTRSVVNGKSLEDPRKLPPVIMMDED